jgi:hypothetical protein
MQEELRQSLHWQQITAWAAAVGAFATCIYAFVVVYGFRVAGRQLEEARNTRENLLHAQKLQALLHLFDELTKEDVRKARRYIYEKLPYGLEGLNKEELKGHWEAAEPALNTFDRIGFLIKAERLELDIVMEYSWPVIWRCWTKSRNLIHWARKRRGDEGYLSCFQHLFEESERYRIEKGCKEPEIY